MAWTVAALAYACVVLATLLVGLRASRPSDGTVVQISNRPWTSSRIVVDRVLDGDTGLRVGDAIVAVNGRPIAAYSESGVATGWPEHALTYTVSRGDTLLDLDVPARDFSIARFVGGSWPALLSLAFLMSVASYVFVHRPLEPGVADLLLLAGLMTLGTVGWLIGDQVADVVIRGPSPWHLLEEIPLAMVWGVVAHFLLVISGRSGWRSARGYGVCLTVPVLVYVLYLTVALPEARDSREVVGRLVQVSLPVSSVLPIACAVLLIVLHATATERAIRQSLGLLLVSLGFGALAWLWLWTIPGFFGVHVVGVAFVPLVFLPAELALVTAILRQRLLDVEVIVTRSVLYVIVTGTVLAVYAGAVWLLHRTFGASHAVGVLVASGVLAMCLQPLFAQLGRRLNRFFFGVRDDPSALVRSLDGMEDYADPHDALAQITALLARSLRLAYAEVVLDGEHAGPALAARHGDPRSHPVTLPLSNGGNQIGQLLLEVEPGREPFGPADDALMGTLQRQIGGLAANVLLTQELLRSRERIVRAREEERRQLHNRLHDGLGASLAAGTMQLEAARHLLTSDPHQAEATLSRLSSSLKETITDLRALVYGLRPPALDQIGLAAAIRGRAEQFSLLGTADSRLTIHVAEHGSLDGLPAAVEVAAYWIAVEATHNVVKHAHASRCLIDISRGTVLEVCVEDDGCGVPPSPRAGGGLRSMSERAAELGGSISLTPSRYGGARLHAQLPITSQVMP